MSEVVSGKNGSKVVKKRVRRMRPWQYGGKQEVMAKAEQIVLGKTTKRQAARELGISYQGMSHAMKSKDIREHLLKVANENAIYIVPSAMKNVRKYVEKLHGDKELTDKQADLGWKATEASLKMGGLLATGGESYHLTQIYHDQKVLISPAIQVLLDEHAKKFTFSEKEIQLIEDATGTYHSEQEGSKGQENG